MDVHEQLEHDAAGIGGGAGAAAGDTGGRADARAGTDRRGLRARSRYASSGERTRGRAGDDAPLAVEGDTGMGADNGRDNLVGVAGERDSGRALIDGEVPGDARLVVRRLPGDGEEAVQAAVALTGQAVRVAAVAVQAAIVQAVRVKDNKLSTKYILTGIKE